MKSDRKAVNPAVSTRFRAMQHRNFQLFIAGQLISLIGTWMQTTAQLWLVYRLTGSAALLGVFGFASQVPMLFLSSIGGYFGDRYDRQRGVIVTQTASMILAFVLAGLTLTHLINEWELIVIAFLVGIVNAFHGIAAEKQTGLAAVAGGISEALVTTAIGLFVAVPAVWMYNAFSGRVEAFDIEMDNSSSELIDYFLKRSQKRRK